MENARVHGAVLLRIGRHCYFIEFPFSFCTARTLIRVVVRMMANRRSLSAGYSMPMKLLLIHPSMRRCRP